MQALQIFQQGKDNVTTDDRGVTGNYLRSTLEFRNGTVDNNVITILNISSYLYPNHTMSLC
jgi:hypothetical protein